ncbi:MAG: phospho-N-acetylmuramoyl-pentapeptide-transferase [Bacteriovoracaceae bacterium]|nr:phospho-N-acetylmuramoyl-pentapeptide-transferase [Bacteriovoracaceae bacterium]
MLYHLLYPLYQKIFLFNIFKYITVRSFIAFLVACLVSILWGKKFIEFMKKLQFGQYVREDGPQSHKKKSGTPTSGGLFILGSILIAVFITGNFLSLPVLVTLGVTLSYTILGWWDDYSKVVKKNSKGVSARSKLFWQFFVALCAGYILIQFNVVDTKLYVPFFKQAVFDFGWFYILFIALVIVGSSNAVNLTDGLDGLAIGPIMTSAMTLGVLSYAAGHAEIANYLHIPFIHGVSELMVVAAAIIGAGIGFLWYNSYPAQVFMGDVGSLSLGGALGTIAVLSKNEILFFFMGGVFVIEALSVIIQVFYFKTRKKRVFRMAPIHHHFELMGWPEPKVIVRFWIISILLAICALATLKLR